MRLKINLLALGLLVVVGFATFIVGQVPDSRQAYIWIKDPTGHHFVPLNGAVAIAADGKSVTITSGVQYNFGTGFMLAGAPPNPVQVSLDTAYVLYRTAPPTGPGPCDIATGASAASADGYRYDCIPDGTGKGFKWARSPVETDW